MSNEKEIQAPAQAAPSAGEVERDSARLDAIQRNLWFVEPDYASGKFSVGKAMPNGQLKHRGKTLREAIDAALSHKEQR